MQQSVFQQSLNTLKSAPAGLTEIHTRNVAAGFLQAFSKFAVETCGCEQPDDRVKLRKAVWHQTVGLHLRDFEKKFPQSNFFLREIAKMECPVHIPGKDKAGPRDESSPSKIILASKLLRAHTEVSEATTCRGCSKRSRCPFVRKIVPNNKEKTSLGAVAKVLFGMSQSCRLHLKDPEQYPFMISGAEIEAGMKLTSQLGRFLEPSALERQLRNVPLADRKAVTAIVKKQLKKNEDLKKQRQEAKQQGLPENLIDPETLISPKVVNEPKQPKFDVNSADWVPEEKIDEFAEINVELRNMVHAKPLEKPRAKVANVMDLPIPERYPEGRQLVKPKTTKSRKPTYDLSRLELHPQAETQKVSGGYVVGEPQLSTPGIEYIKPQLMRGKRVTDNVGIASKVWDSQNSHVSELKFLKRVPFQADPPNAGAKTDPTLARVLEKRTSFKNEEKFEKVSTQAQEVQMKEDMPSQESSPMSQGKLRFPKLPSWDAATLNKVKISEKTEKVRIGVNGAVSERLRTDFSKLMRPKTNGDSGSRGK
jgi:hypothetical protein